MKVLLVGNIANNSYVNAKLLRRKGVEADVLCHNYTHVMGQPEWEDADLEGEVDEFLPDWRTVNLKGFQRPDWFLQRTVIPRLDSKYRPYLPLLKALFLLVAVLSSPRPLRKRLLLFPHYYLKWRVGSKIPPVLKEILKALSYSLCSDDAVSALKKKRFESLQCFDREEELGRLLKKQSLIEEFGVLFPQRADKLSREDILPYLGSLPWFREIFSRYDLLHASGVDPIHAMMAAPHKPYVAFEHGTLRELPFEDSALGRLLSMSYRRASRVIITNPDTIHSARKLGLTNYVFIPHPLEETKYRPKPTSLRESLKSQGKVDYIVFCPTRHNWREKGNDIQIEGFTELLRRYRQKVLLILASWGNEVERSKRLIERLGIGNHVQWVPVLHEMKHIEYINAADIVMDQMILPSFGGISFKAMSCGKPVLASYRHEENQWCLKDPPPLVSVFDKQGICEKAYELLDNTRLRAEIGANGRNWVLEHHSSELVTDELIRVYEEALKGHKNEGMAV